MSYQPIWPDDEVTLGGGDGLNAKLGGVHHYKVSGSLLASQPDVTSRFRLQLTDFILSHSGQGTPCSITTSNIDLIKKRSLPSITRRVETLLREIVVLAEWVPGRSFKLSINDADRLTNDLCRRASTFDGSQLHKLLEHCQSKGWIAFSGRTLVDDRYTISPTLEGMIHLEESAAVPSDSRSAFVAMWFGPEMTTAFENAIVPAITSYGYEPVRIDRLEHSNKIDDEIIAEIRKCRFMVADFSCGTDGVRGGVYFEAGFALALGRKVIWTVRAEDLERVHFDTRQFNHIVWSDPAELCEKLGNRIGAVIGRYSE